MEAQMLVGLVGVVGSFGFGASACLGAMASWRRRAASVGGNPSFRSLMRWRLRNGVKSLLPISSFLLRFPRVKKIVLQYEMYASERDVDTSDKAICSLFLGLSIAAAALSWILSGSVACIFVVPVCLIVCAVAYANGLEDKRKALVQESVPRALESMSSCFGSGYTLLQTFSQVSKDVTGPLSALFARSAHVLEAGGSAHDALEVIREDPLAGELAFVAVALDVQHQTGGSTKEVLDAASDTVKGEIALKRSLKVQTAQAKLSARIVTVMPIVLIGLFSLISPGFLTPFFSSVIGWAMLVLAILMQVAGVLLVRRALSVGGEL